MLQQQPLVGLKSLWMGNIAGDGDMGTSLTLVSYAVIDTPVITTEEGDTTNFDIEQSDDPYYQTKTPGQKTLTLSIYGISPTVLQRFFGGTLNAGATSADPGSWEAPAQFPEMEQSIVLEHKQGGHVKIPRAKITATWNWTFQKNNLPQINISATILAPTKENVASVIMSQAAYVPA